MKRLRPAGSPEHGYTLVELLLYVAIVGAVLTSVTTFFGIAVDARVKGQTVNEVNDQAVAVMDYITQTIRNATSITSPAAAGSGSSLTLVVPTGALSPTVFSMSNPVLGYNVDGGTTDTSDSNSVNATKFVASASGTITNLYAYIGPTVAASPNNKGMMAIYSGTSSQPTALLASSASTTLTANSFTTFPISSVSVTSGQTYWLAYDTNGLTSTDNNIRYHAGTTNQSMFTAQTYGSFPSGAWTGSGQNREYSMYATIDTGTASAFQVQEGSGSAVALTSNDVSMTGLTFKNLTRSGTSGIVQVSFTLSRTNPSNRNEYDYQKTFTTSAEIGW